MNKETIEIYQANTRSIAVTVTRAGVSFPLTGYTCRLIVKREKTDTVKIIDKTADPGDIVDNVVTFPLSATDTNIDLGDYWYEVYVSKVSPAFAKTVAQGVFSVLDSLTTP
jgi:hypothetical protein